MECPDCKRSLKQYKHHRLLVDMCRNCGGIWFDPGEMREYVEFLQKDGAEIPDARIEWNRTVITEARIQETGRLCPQCRKPMRKFNFAYDSNIILDRCPSCGGMWADRGEVFQMATHIKGNPRLNKLGLSVLEDSKEAQAIKELANFGKELSTNASWLYFPRIILPIGDDIKTSVFPATVMCLVLLNLGIFLCQTFFVLDLESFVNDWGLIPVVILSGEGLVTMISSVFLHGNVLHLAGNMFFLWVFGDNVEEAVGHIHFLGNYLIFGLTGGLLHIVASPSLDIPAIGSSGAVAGVMGAYFVLFPHAQLRTLVFNRVIDIPAFYYLGGWILMQGIFGAIYSSQGISGGIGWFAHIGGFLTGATMTWFVRRLREHRKNVTRL